MKKIIIFLLTVLPSCNSLLAESVIGKVSGVLNVSETGAATYTIPINSLPSPNEFSPSISLTYNSQMGNGLAGFGWNLSGLSAITIGPRNKYFDGTADGMHQRDDNAYFLDGMRLLLVSGENGKQGATYRTESEQYSIIRIDSVLAETPAIFTIKKKDGSTYRYGSSTGRARYTDNASYEWALDYAEDCLGNYIVYTYEQFGLTLCPSSITYGRNKNNSSSPIYTISFSYGSRSDEIPVHRFEASIPFAMKLTGISCMVQGNYYRTYHLTYDYNVYSHLTSVREDGLNSSSYPATSFVWENLPEYNLQETAPGIPAPPGQAFSDIHFFAADVDNNGQSELIGLYDTNGTGNQLRTAKIWKQNPSTGSFYIDESHTTASGIAVGNVYMPCRQGGSLAHVSNRQDNSILLPYYSNLGGDGRVVFDCIKEEVTFPYFMQSASDKICHTIADIDRDGYDEIILVERKENHHASSTRPVSIIRLNLSNSSLTSSNLTMDLNGDPTRIASADINGDGMSDLLVCTTEGFYIYWNNAGSFSDTNRYYGTGFGECDVLEIGDVNADGLPDLVINKHKSELTTPNTWLCAVNSGTTTAPFSFYDIEILENLGANNYGNNEAYCLLHDLDGDGKMDLVAGMAFHLNNHFNSGQVVLLKSNGATFSYLESATFATESLYPSFDKIVQGDFDGDGVIEIMYYGGAFHTPSSTAAWRRLKPAGYSAASNRITKITDGLGQIQKIDYGLLTHEDVYEQDSTPSFPLLGFRAAMSVAKRVEAIASNDTLWTSFKYGDALYHWQGKGFLGFKKKSITSSDGTKAMSECGINMDYYVLYPHAEKIYASNDCLWKENISTTIFNPVGSKSYFVYNQNQREDDRVNGYFDISTHSYGAYGNIINEEHTDEKFESASEYMYWESNNPNIYIKGLPSVIETTKSVDSSQEETERIVYTRENNTGLPLSCKTYRNGTLVETTLYSYNTCGQLVTLTTINGNSTDSLTTTYTYMPNGRLSQITDPMGLTTSYGYNVYGNVFSEKNYLGYTTHHTYDNMLRETLSYSPISRVENIYEQGDYGNAAYKVTTTAKGKPTTISYYDSFERKIAEAEKRFDGRFLYIDYSYLKNGQLGFVSFPHISPSVSNEGTYSTYDFYNRKISEVDTQGKTSTWEYEPFVVSSNVEGVAQTTTYAHRNVINTIQNLAGTVDFSVDAFGRTTQIVKGTNTTTINYDDFGRTLQTNDMLGITRSYVYDSNGHLQSVTQGSSTKYTEYDKFGRLLSNTFHDSGTTDTQTYYTYNAKNQLVCDSSSNHVYKYTYDAYGRLKQENRRVIANNTESMTCSYTYNSLNQLTQKNVVLGSTGINLTEKYTYSNGWCRSISVNDSLVWKLVKEDYNGHVQNTSNHLDNISWSYDIYGNLLSKSVSGVHSLIQSYDYDLTTGNLIQDDNSSYTYDDLNRLIKWNNNNYSYDGNNNLTSIIPLGTLSYNNYKLSHANTNNPLSVTPYECSFAYLKSIERPYGIEENGKRVIFAYNGNKQRVWMKSYEYQALGHPTLLGTRYYISENYEIDQKNGEHKRYYYYVGGTPYDAPAVVLIEDSVPVIYQIYRDRIGSIVMYAGRNSSTSLSYNPWGVRFPASNAHYSSLIDDDALYCKFIRTYTGHEEIPYFGLLNANARIYNPHIGRFMSPDPLLTINGAPQDFNPYVSARNNPLSYVDQDGEFPWVIIAAVAGGTMNVLTNLDDIKGFKEGAIYFIIGTTDAVLTATGHTLTGAILFGSANNLISQLINKDWDLKRINCMHILSEGFIAGYSSYMGSYVSALISSPINKLTSHISNSLLRESASKALGNYISSFASQTGFNLLKGYDFSTSIKNASTSSLVDLAMGAIDGFASEKIRLNLQKKYDSINSNTQDIINRAMDSPNYPYGSGNINVFVGKDADGIIRNVCMSKYNTINNFKNSLEYSIVATNCSARQGDYLKQALINLWGLGKNGGTLKYNKRNTFSPRW